MREGRGETEEEGLDATTVASLVTSRGSAMSLVEAAGGGEGMTAGAGEMTGEEVTTIIMTMTDEVVFTLLLSVTLYYRHRHCRGGRRQLLTIRTVYCLNQLYCPPPSTDTTRDTTFSLHLQEGTTVMTVVAAMTVTIAEEIVREGTIEMTEEVVDSMTGRGEGTLAEEATKREAEVTIAIAIPITVTGGIMRVTEEGPLIIMMATEVI